MYDVHKYVCADSSVIEYCRGTKSHAPSDCPKDWWNSHTETGPIWRKTEWIQAKDRDLPPWRRTAITLWWNGARWVVWIEGLYCCEPTDFTDKVNPPLQWAEGVYALVS